MRFHFLVIFLLLILNVGCKTYNESKIEGKWKGIFTQITIIGNEYTSSYEIEFSDNNKGWEKPYHILKNTPLKTIIFNYKIHNDSIFFTTENGEKYTRGIKLITDSKLILTSPKDNFTYELDKKD